MLQLVEGYVPEVDGEQVEFGGVDTILTGIGRDMVFGGAEGDTITANDGESNEAGVIVAPDGNNIVFGDYGFVDYLINDLEVLANPDDPESGDLLDTTRDIDRVWSYEDATALGGDDTIRTGAGNDIVLGGTADDTIHTGEATGKDIALGDNGRLTSLRGTDSALPDTVYAVHEFAICVIETIGFLAGDDGDDTVTASPNADILFGGGGDDVIFGLAGADLIFGDDGWVGCAGVPYDPDNPYNGVCVNLGGSFDFEATNVFTLSANGNNDLIYAGADDDIVLGEQGMDIIYGEEDDDLIIGGSDVVGALDTWDVIDGGSGNDAIAGDNAECCRRPDLLDPRMRALAGTVIYGTSLPDGTDGHALVTGTSQNDPAGVAQYVVTLLDHSDDIQANHPELWGDDYIAGGAGQDEIFGQLGDDVVMGDAYVDGLVLAEYDHEAMTAASPRPVMLTRATGLVGAWRDGTEADADTLSVNPAHRFADEEAGRPTDDDHSGDGDDYIEGNGGNDTIFGGLGQDDIIGDSSNLYGLGVVDETDPLDLKAPFDLVSPTLRPTGADLIFGGAGIAIARNDIGDATVQDREGTIVFDGDGTIITTPTGHARDADAIAGDNAVIFRLVGTNGVQQSPNAYLSFAYDTYTAGLPASQQLRLIPRAVDFLDYTLGGPAYDTNPANTPDRGVADEIHGEAGDDWVYGMAGNDVLFGDGQDDDVVGGYGDDWISAGTGDDGILGGDGRISTSRNSSTGWDATGKVCRGNADGTCYSEPLYGVAALLERDPDSRASNGNVLNEFIYTPGQIQTETINVAGVLNKTVNLTPSNVDPRGDELFRPEGGYDDIIFGGLGDDAIHGGSGDDALSGAEALEWGWAPRYDTTCDVTGCVTTRTGVVRIDFGHPVNPGDVLRYNPDDVDGWHYDRTQRAGEFDLYNEYEPRREIRFAVEPRDATAPTVVIDGVPVPTAGNLTLWNCTGYTPSGHTCIANSPIGDFPFTWFLTNVSNEGFEVLSCTEHLPNGTCVATGFQRTDGNDIVFGDLGNDWMVGGTGHDTLWGGWGNDLLQADDRLADDPSTPDVNEALNDLPETHTMFEDRVYGGAGRDVLVGNTGGDRLIDWIGEFNSYIVPFAPFGIATVSRQRPPALDRFLYALSMAQGADQTIRNDEGWPDPERNGEPIGEMGLITPRDGVIWRQQSGAPADPQAGNIPGGRRDLLRTANFNDGTLTGFAPDSGVWEVSGAVLTVSAASLGMDAAAVFYLDQALPTYYEIGASVAVIKPTAGWNANAFLIFDYFGPDDFKFAGLDQATNKVVVGHYDSTLAEPWHYDREVPMLVKAGRYYDVLVVVNGLVVTVLVDGVARLTYQYDPRNVDGEWHGLEMGLVGVGSDNSRGSFDNFSVAVLPPQITYQNTENFGDGVADLFTAGSTDMWSVEDGKYAGMAAVDVPATSILTLETQPEGDAYIELEARVGVAVDGWAGLVFDHYTADDFKFVALDVAAGAVVIGHRLGATWFTDATFTIPLVAGESLLMAELSGASVNVYFAGALLGAFSYNGPLLDGALGLVVRSGAATFDDVRLFVGTHFINAVDNVPPVLTVPPDVTVSAESGQASVYIDAATIGSATATDNVPGVVVEPSGVPSDNYFPVGVTAITWTATDVFGNETIGTQLVTVLVPLPAVNVKATDSSGAEQGANPIVFTVARSLALGTVTVGLAWSGTATFGDDYSVTATGGTLSANGTALTLADGVASVTVTVMPVDDGIIESAETVVLGVVAGTGYSVGSPSSASGSIADNDAFPVVSVSAGDAAGAEPADPITFTVTRTSDLTAPVVINLVWSGTAVFGVDYTVTSAGGTLSTNGTQLVLAAGVASEAITVTPINDANIEDTEDVVLAVATGAGYLVGSPSSASGSIADDDVASGPVISVTASDALGAEPADSITFTITRTGDVTATVTINLGWSGTATYGVDYTVTASEGTFTGSTLMLAGGTTSVTFTVTPLDDSLVEATEGVVLTVLAGADYAVGSPSTASGTITDNDAPPALPVVTVVATDDAGSETGPDAITFTLTRTGDTSKALVVGFGWFGTAKLGKDFNAKVLSGGSMTKTTVTFAAGASTLTITITPLDDATIEALETVIMTLKTGTGYTPGDPSSATGWIANNDGKVAASTSLVSTSLVSTSLAEPTAAADTSIEPLSTDVTVVDSDAPSGHTGRSKFDMLAV